jgi:hypothetical protein
MMVDGMRSLLVAAWVAAALACQARAALVPVADFSDLVLWAGEGEQEAGFVLQFSATQTPTSVAWGYRWTGAATMEAMMNAVAGSTTVTNGSSPPPGLDGRLAVAAQYFSFGDSGGVFVNSITYDQVGLPVAWTQGMRSIANTFQIDGTYPTLYTRPDAGGEWLGEGESGVMSFGASLVGASDITLTPGGWYGFVQSSGAETFTFSQPAAAVPEPGTWAALAAAAAGAGLRCRGRRSLTRGGSPATRVPRA